MKVPGELVDAWAKVSDASDSLAALGNMAIFRDALGEWEASLARDALANGASWATIGEALGTSRQAAWERLRPGIAEAIEADRRRITEQRVRASKKRGEPRT